MLRIFFSYSNFYETACSYGFKRKLLGLKFKQNKDSMMKEIGLCFDMLGHVGAAPFQQKKLGKGKYF